MENKFLDRVSNLIQNKTARESITAELESHILDKADYYEEIGYCKEVAMQKATEEMGNPDDTAVPLNALHKNGKSKNVWSIITVVFAVFTALFNLEFGRSFIYCQSEYFATSSVLFEVISFLICTAFVLLIYKAYRQKNLVSAIAILAALIFVCALDVPEIFYYEGMSIGLFQPVVYPLVMIFLYGFSGYYNGIFDSCFISDNEGAFCRFGAILIFLVFLIATVALLISISRQLKMKTGRCLYKPVRIICSVMGIVLAVNLVIMSVSIAFAWSGIEDKRLENQTAREYAIDLVVNMDVTESLETITDKLSDEGYECYITRPKSLVFRRGLNSAVIDVFYFMDDYSVSFYDRSYNEDSVFYDEDSDMYISKEEQSQIKNGMSLGEFLSLGFYRKVDSMEKAYNSDGENMTFDFSFSLNSNSDESWQCHFTYDKDKGEFVLSEFGKINY